MYLVYGTLGVCLRVRVRDHSIFVFVSALIGIRLLDRQILLLPLLLSVGAVFSGAAASVRIGCRTPRRRNDELTKPVDGEAVSSSRVEELMSGCCRCVKLVKNERHLSNF